MPSLFHQPAVIVLGRDDRGRPHASWFDEAQVKTATEAAVLMGMRALAVCDGEVAALAGRLPQGRLFASGKAFVPFVKEETYDALVAHLPPEGEGEDEDEAGAGKVSQRRSGRDPAAGAAVPATATHRAAAGKKSGKAAGRKAATSSMADAGDGSGAGDGAGDGASGSGGNGNGGNEGGAGGPDGADDHRATDWPQIAVGSLVLATEGPMEGWFESIVEAAEDNDIFLVRWRDWPDEPHFSRHRNQLALLPSGKLG